MGLFEKLFGSYSKRELKRIEPIQRAVLALEDEYRAMPEEKLRGKTQEFRDRLEKGETLDDILPEAFATMREAMDRVIGKRPFPVQVIGGIVLHQGRIAEMKTGEGKTFVSCMPAYLNALQGEGVHIVTVNEYLAKYASELLGKLYRYLGMSVGLIIHEKNNAQRRAAYRCDITYGTNNEFGFDYLRDNMVIYKKDKVQREFHYAIVDEVDSILIDEARTPLIISGPGDKSTSLYQMADAFARTLKQHKVKEMDDKVDNDDVDGDYIVDEKARTATLTASGVKKAEGYFHVENLNDAENITLLHHINQAIKAHGIMHRDTDYVVKDGEVIIVDEFTGRLMMGRRYNEGLHQAIEAKEGVEVARESKTLATITFQNYFRLYQKLAGMTGTALTEEGEFQEIYKLDVIEIPTNKPMVRTDYPDAVYKTEQGKYRAIIDQIVECHEKGQPVLVGTTTVEKSELFSSMLKRRGIKHEVLNAKYHEREAEIVAQAGKYGAVTIATNMAGRGTDIMLGGNAEFKALADMRKQGYEEDLISEASGVGETTDETVLAAREVFHQLLQKHTDEIQGEYQKVKDAGGLFIIGTERHESRRIDNQLRGRAGRQGDPGASRFYISLEDDLMRLFGGERIQGMMETLGVDEDMPIENRMLSNSIENAQKKIEGRNFSIRKNVLQYDDVMNAQREIIYKQRSAVLDGDNIKDSIMSMVDECIEGNVENFLSDTEVHDNWNLAGLKAYFLGWLTRPEDFNYTPEELGKVTRQEIIDMLKERAHRIYNAREEGFGLKPDGEPLMRELERVILLKVVDSKWMDHIDNMQELKQGISLRSYAQRDPVVEYRVEGSDMFDAMVSSIREDTVRMLFTVQVRKEAPPEREQVAKPTVASHGDQAAKSSPTTVRKKKVGRNDPCPCGSGKKYKHCHGRDPHGTQQQ